MSFHIRDFDTAHDNEAALSFIRGSQAYERQMEPDRRTDPQVADEYLPVLMQSVADKRGRIFVAEQDGRAIGWAAIIVEENMLFVVKEQRTYGYITELYVEETSRSVGVGQALMAACEDEARRLGLGHVMIGFLTRSERTAEIYARAGYQPYTSELRKYL